MASDYPPGDQDELGWDREVHGRMLDHADEEPPATVPYDPAADPFLTEG